MKKLLSLSVLAIISFSAAAANHIVTSPDGRLSVNLQTGSQLTVDINYDGEPLMKLDHLTLKLKNGTTLGEHPRIKKQQIRKGDETIRPTFPYRKAEVDSRYNELKLWLQGGYGIELRAFDDGVAYRFFTELGGEILIEDETMNWVMTEGTLAHAQMNKGFHTASENAYQHLKLSELNNQDGVANLPILVETERGMKVLMSEAAQWDYPGMFLKSGGSSVLSAAMPPHPEKADDGSVFIAHTSGTRSYPWRYFVTTFDARQLLETTMNVRLSEPCRLDDTSWIEPQVVTWDWFSRNTVYGPDITFTSGVNMPTYKYFIDFAQKFGIKSLLIDDGWAKERHGNPTIARDGLDIPELVKYANQRGVNIMLWVPWHAVKAHPEVFELYEKWGVKGMKIDFMDRSDQEMVNFYENTVQQAARHHLMVDFHGAYKPAGLEFMYPNLLSYEGVRGLEQAAGCHPDNTLYVPFVRGVSGPLDFTPGLMVSWQPEDYKRSPEFAAIGTRASQLAMFVIFESGIQMLSDTPSNYYRNEDCARFIAGVPLTWDETRGLNAQIGRHAIVAKRKGEKWYLGGLTASEAYVTEVTLDFLKDGKTYTLTSFEDGPLASRVAVNYVKKQRKVHKNDRIKISMARNGGYAAIIE